MLSSILTYKSQSKNDVVYFNGECENIVITDDNTVCSVLVGEYDKRCAYFAYSTLTDCHITKIDKYVLTHYSYYMIDHINTLFDLVLVNELYLPLPQNSTEESLYRETKETANEYGVSVFQAENETAITVGRHKFIPIYNSAIGTLKKNLFTIYSDGDFYTYLNIDIFEGRTKSIALEVINGSRAIIIGRYESYNSEHKFTYKLENPNVFIFSSESTAIHKDVLEYYEGRRFRFSPKRISLIH